MESYLKAGVVFLIMALSPVWAAGNSGKQTYNLPAGDAVATLRQFVETSGAQVSYFVNRVGGVRTNAVRGEFSSREALDRMLAGTELFPVRDEKSGAVTINRTEAFAAPKAPARKSESRSGNGLEKPREEVITLSAFSVDAASYRGYVASSTLIGGKTARRILDVPQTVSVITRDLIDDTGAILLGESLSRIVPGVTSVSGDSSASAGAYIRGFRAQNWSVDGATMRTLSTLTTFNTDAIEVIKGPASVTFGAFAAYGGYISVLPKYANRNHRDRVEVSAGTGNFYAGMVDVGGGLGSARDLQWRLVLGVLDADRAGWNYDFNHIEMVAPSFAYDFSDRSRVRVRFEVTKTDVKNSSTAMNAAGQIVKEFSSFGPETPRNHFNAEKGQNMQMVWETQLNDEWSTKMNVFGALGEKDFDLVALTGQAPAADYLFNNFMAHYWWKNFYVDYSVSWEKKEFGNTGISMHTVGSLSLDHWDISYRLYDGNLIPPYNTRRINPTSPDWSVYPTSIPTYPTRYIYYNTEWLGGAVIENVIGLFKDKLLLSAALRFNYDNRSGHTAWRTPQNQNPGGTYVGNPTPTNINEKVTKRFGLVYKPTDKMSIYAGSTEAFLAVGAIFKADGSRLSPETGKNEEVGVKLDLLEALGGNFTFTGALFRVNVMNKWRGDPNNVGFFIQDGAQQNQGVDMQLSYTSQKLSVIAGYYKGDGPTDKLTGQRAVIVPDLTWNLWLKYNITDRLSVGGGVKHTGDTLSNNRLLMTDPYTTSDLFATYTMPMAKGQMRYRLGVSNLMDDSAVFRMDSAATVFREEGRRVKLTASFLW